MDASKTVPSWVGRMIGIFEQPSVIAAIITVVGGAIIALVNKFYVRNRLRVEVRAWNYRTSEALKKIAMEPLDDIDPMRTLIRAGGYMMVTITNISKKKISGVSVMAPNSDMSMFLQIDDANEIMEIKKAQPFSVGDIQPKHSRVMHIWCNVDVSEFDFFRLKRVLRISADEFDSVLLRFPAPRYLRTKYEGQLVPCFIFLVLAAFFIALFSGFIHE
jgi:hypothetical protein